MRTLLACILLSCVAVAQDTWISKDTIKQVYWEAAGNPISSVEIIKFDKWDASTEYTAIIKRMPKLGSGEEPEYLVVRMKCDQNCWNGINARAKKEPHDRLYSQPPPDTELSLRSSPISQKEAVRLYKTYASAVAREHAALSKKNFTLLQRGHLELELHPIYFEFSSRIGMDTESLTISSHSGERRPIMNWLADLERKYFGSQSAAK